MAARRTGGIVAGTSNAAFTRWSGFGKRRQVERTAQNAASLQRFASDLAGDLGRSWIGLPLYLLVPWECLCISGGCAADLYACSVWSRQAVVSAKPFNDDQLLAC